MRRYPKLDPVSDDPRRYTWRKIFGKAFIGAAIICGLYVIFKPASEKASIIELFLVSFGGISVMLFGDSNGLEQARRLLRGRPRR